MIKIIYDDTFVINVDKFKIHKNINLWCQRISCDLLLS